ncbi:hypothetical protein MUG91_G5n44 [Manis pentadactyla]|nr:hypothetical protein MUG91_G5n44 [Manis pentadactyla]
MFVYESYIIVPKTSSRDRAQLNPQARATSGVAEGNSVLCAPHRSQGEVIELHRCEDNHLEDTKLKNKLENVKITEKNPTPSCAVLVEFGLAMRC